VTFRGVVVGRVSDVTVKYNRETKETVVPVLIDLEPDRAVNLRDPSKPPDQVMQDMIGEGLRARLDAESLVTNQQDVLLDFYPNTPVRLVPTDIPYPQIPTVPSALGELQASIGSVADSLPGLTAAASATLKDAAGFLTPENQQKVSAILDDVQKLSSMLAQHRDDLGQTIASLHDTSTHLDRLVQDLDSALRDNRRPLADAIGQLGGTERALQQLGGQLSGTIAENRGPLKRFSGGSLMELTALIAETRRMVRRATDTLDTLERNPSRFLFGSGDQGYRAK
jgi:paraquat-inducible protein B